jgi:hypothetical protein
MHVSFKFLAVTDKGKNQMLKFAIAATVIGMFAVSPAFADDMMPCDEASMTKVNKMIDADKDKAKADAAKAEMKLASKAPNASECATHLNKAAAAVMAK